MKNLKQSLLIVLLLVMATIRVNAQGAEENKRKQLNDLLSLKTNADTLKVINELNLMAAGKTEADMNMAAQYFYRIKKVATSDSVLKQEVLKFPLGTQARSEEQQPIYKIKDLAKAEAAYDKWVAKFPPQNYPALPLGEDRVIYDYIRSYLAIGYAKEKNVAKAKYFGNMMEADFWKGNSYSGLSAAFYETGDLNDAAEYARKAVESTAPYAEGKKGESNAAKFSASGYAGLLATYANILLEQKKYDEALTYIELANKNSKGGNISISYRYAKVLMTLNRDKEAFDKLDEIVKSGKANEEMAANFKKLYIKVKGSDAGFDQYEADIRKGVLANLQKRLTTEMVKEPAAMFTLTDVDGKKVSLADLKGKVVILDFWATWCGPCKASFPAMQMAVDKYKADPNVKFLFIHTWERTETPAKDAKEYVTANKYNFEVLVDAKNPKTKVNDVVTSYKVNGIPAKFIIDSKGNIRFKLTGFDGSKEAAVDEVSMMIEMAKKASAE